MSIFSGSFSLSRYKILGLEKAPSLADLNQKLKAFQARPLKLSSNKELSFGWDHPVTSEDSAALGEHWDMSHCQVEDGYMLRLRIEKRKVPNSLLQIVFKEKLAEAEAAQEDGKPVSRKRRKDLLEEARQELIHQCLPHVSYTDLFWDESRGEVILFSTSKGVQSIFEELFRKTFSEHLGSSLVKVAPPLLGLSQEDWQVSMSSKTIERMGQALPGELAGASI